MSSKDDRATVSFKEQKTESYASSSSSSSQHHQQQQQPQPTPHQLHQNEGSSGLHLQFRTSLPYNMASSRAAEENSAPDKASHTHAQVQVQVHPHSHSQTSIPSLSVLNESIQRSSNPTEPSSSSSPPGKRITDPGLLNLLGPNVGLFPYSEKAFIETMKLRTEQERTKQEYYKAEIAGRNLSIIQHAVQAQIPTHLIPQLCVGNSLSMSQVPLELSNPTLQLLPFISKQQSQLTLQPQNLQSMQTPLLQEQQLQIIQETQRQRQQELQAQAQAQAQSQAQAQAQAQAQSQSQAAQGLQPSPYIVAQRQVGTTQPQRDPFNANPNSPSGFKFGGGNGGNQGTHLTSATKSKRPMSPAKIGAAAVANLATPTAPFRRPKLSESGSGSQVGAGSPARRAKGHQRHSSMPTNVAGVASSTPFSKLRKARQGSQAFFSDLNTLDSAGGHQNQQKQLLQSPLGTTTTIQVNPIPAQPLHKQSKLSVQPLQESMTSFQHIIQFHHWRPEEEMEGTRSGTGTGTGTGTRRGGGGGLESSSASTIKSSQPPSTKRRKPLSYSESIGGNSASNILQPAFKFENPAPASQEQEDDDDDERKRKKEGQENKEKDHIKADQEFKDSRMEVVEAKTEENNNDAGGAGDAGDVGQDADDADLSMDVTINYEGGTEKVASDANPPTQGHSRQQLNVGRYPHDILSGNKD